MYAIKSVCVEKKLLWITGSLNTPLNHTYIQRLLRFIALVVLKILYSISTRILLLPSQNISWLRQMIRFLFFQLIYPCIFDTQYWLLILFSKFKMVPLFGIGMQNALQWIQTSLCLVQWFLWSVLFSYLLRKTNMYYSAV